MAAQVLPPDNWIGLVVLMVPPGADETFNVLALHTEIQQALIVQRPQVGDGTSRLKFSA
jgi:hypothetical protein